jgi:acyl carrier protein
MQTTVTKEQVEETIVEAVAGLGPAREDVTREATFESLDVDSLDLVEVAQIVEERFGIELRGEDTKDLKTVGDAIDLVVARAS